MIDVLLESDMGLTPCFTLKTGMFVNVVAYDMHSYLLYFLFSKENVSVRGYTFIVLNGIIKMEHIKYQRKECR
jgi:hypothetical protein